MNSDSHNKLPVVLTLGNPNTGKSTLFNALTGMHQQIANFPGVTVESMQGEANVHDRRMTIVDLPGTYSLAAQSPDEMLTIDALLGRVPQVGNPDVVVIVVDANNLRRNLFLASQILEISQRVVLVLNMMDLITANGISIDIQKLSAALQIPVVPMCAARGEGLEMLKQAIGNVLNQRPPAHRIIDQALRGVAIELAAELSTDMAPLSAVEIERALIDNGGYAEQRLLAQSPKLESRLEALRNKIGGGRNLATLEASRRYGWINEVLDTVEVRKDRQTRPVDLIDKVLNHPLLGSIVFVLTMAVVFQSVFAWAGPLMEMIDGQSALLGELINSKVKSSLLASFLSDGVVAGVGSVLIFLPQIIILFSFIILLEDTGYMARAAFLMDRLMRWCGLSGQSFIPMLSSFACAVPGIMGTRVVPGTRDRIATIVAAPFMTCSARLPVYALLIAAFVPSKTYLGGWVNLHGLVLLAFYLLGMVAGVTTAYLLSLTLLRGPSPTFLLEMPPYRVPNIRSMSIKLYGRAKIFLRRAGTVIFSIAVVIWFLASFPRTTFHELNAPDNAVTAPMALEQSYLGIAGKSVAPLFGPLGWDWKITAAVIASFPAREVVIAVLGTIYAIDANEEGSLIQRMQQARRPDGSPVYTLPMALGLMIFYALCLQCVATIAVMRRETNTWRWPIFAWVYMTTLGYIGALICYQVGTSIGMA
ncbi:MAG TPA: ferrous iron transport protein B [Gammaproteobacteria bacterium]|nr:ferrous iron transport protein B [Gammaproteobacteria bacterium]